MLKINVNSVPDNSTMYLRGVVDYSFITKRLEGAELDADNARKARFGMMPESKPHSRLIISQTSIAYSDPANPTIGEQFISQKFYQSKKSPGKNAMFCGINKSSYSLPEVYTRDESDPTKLIPIVPEFELAPGMKVTLLIKVFPTKANKGVSLEAVICDEPIRYSGVTGATSGALSAAGFTVAAPAPSVTSSVPAVSAVHAPPVIPPVSVISAPPAPPPANYGSVPPALSPPVPPPYLATAPASVPPPYLAAAPAPA
jgi:hypothetical protein